MIYFFEFVLLILPLTACDTLKSDVMVIHACVNGLEASGTIKFEQDTLLRLQAVVNDLSGIQTSNKNCHMKRESNKERMQFAQPPEPFRDINIYPNIEDVTQNRRPFLRPNVVSGRYFDVEDYLDIQFRLLREDYLRPLREGIADHVRGGSSSRKCEAPSVRIYRDVKFLDYVCDDVVKPGQKPREGTLLSFTTHGKKPIDWEHSKRFMYGTLLCFSKNQFETLLFATVCERDEKLLSKGQLLVKFCEKYDEDIYDVRKPFVMVESEVFFEPYYQVLKTLKTFNESSFPMVKYIVEMSEEDSPPNYLLPSDPEDPPTECVLTHGRKKHRITVLDKSTWPTAEQLSLDESQHSALHSALTNELVVIQGPPGTGKTFMALKIAETLIVNKTIMHRTTPILVVCLTNHALDQFLVGILKLDITKNITRIGGQSRCEEMAPYNLKNRRVNREHSRASSRLFATMKNNLEYLRSVLHSFKTKLDCFQSRKGIFISSEVLSPLFKNVDASTPQDLKLRYFKWLFGKNFFIASGLQPDDGDSFYSFSSMHAYLQNCYDYEMRELQHAADQNGYDVNYVYYAKTQLETQRNFIGGLIENMEYHLQNQEPLNEQEVAQLLQQNLWKLSPPKRLQLHSQRLQQRQNYYQEQVRHYSNEVLSLNERIEELRFQDDVAVLRGSDVVGMTTNGAARLHSMLKLLKCQIVIVEEAAEVMESHIIACLTNHCEHLILIGDHKQLRPSIAVYELGRHYNFDVSLFERFVKNRGQCETLSVQHRMAPSLATLITPAIYPTLSNDKSVLERPPVDGLPRRLFFVTHNHPEQQDSEISSRRNEHEAHFLLALCNHLVLQGYQESQITILSTYKGQMFYIKKEKKKMDRLQGVYVTVVDNFQGEENDIILLSLVRSNAEGRIGFLATENRVCVALSRARQGLYIVGNMNILSEASDIWKKVKSSLLDEEGFGPALPLRCQVHPDQTHQVATAEDFMQYAPEGGCTKICTVQLDCGHSCDKVCHALNRDHTNIKCNPKNPCIRLCEAGLHGCKKKCVENCGNCRETVTKMLPCKHEQSMACSMDPVRFLCSVIVEKEFEACKHIAIVRCSEKRCPHLCEIRLPCGHQCINNCHPDRDPDHMDYECRKPCTNLNKNCKEDHACQRMCFERCLDCDVKVERKVKCGHLFEMKCTDDPDKILCKKKCKQVLPCGHWCKRKCFEPCEPCQEKVNKTIESCQHSVQVLCGEEAVREMCLRKCERQLPCGHPCTRRCSEPCSEKCSVHVEIVTGLCGHEVPLLCWEKANGKSQPSDINHCHKPCMQVLVCGHECKGECRSCNQGRCHVPCKQRCTNTLVCGHRCTGLCDVACPPCQLKCDSQCSHGQKTCRQHCSNQCVGQCKLKCVWSCGHHKCNHPCASSCNRLPCDEPCKKKVPGRGCDHPCPGLCGEPCPSLCWICDREVLTAEAFIQGAEVTDDPKFIFLPDCRHTLEVQGLECWLQWQSSNLCVLACPRCETPITKLPRYKTLIKQVYSDFSRIRQKMFSHQTEVTKKSTDLQTELARLQSLAIHKYLNEGALKFIEESLTTLQRQPPKQKGRGMYDMLFATTVESIAIRTSVISSVFSVLERYGINHIQDEKVQAIINFILNILNTRNKNLLMQVAHDLNLEIMRLHHVLQGLKLKPKIFFMSSGTSDIIKTTLLHICQNKRYNDEMQQQTLALFKFLGVSNMEECEVKIAIPFQLVKSLWLKCSNDHFTFIQFVPKPKTLKCAKCEAPLLSVEPPVFMKAKKEETSSTKDVPTESGHVGNEQPEQSHIQNKDSGKSKPKRGKGNNKNSAASKEKPQNKNSNNEEKKLSWRTKSRK